MTGNSKVTWCQTPISLFLGKHPLYLEASRPVADKLRFGHIVINLNVDVEVFDSTNGEIIARFVERQAARQAVGGVQSSQASGWREILPGIERWGRIVREYMDAIHDL